MTLEFKVTGQHIAWVNNTAHVVADSRNYLRAAFELSEEWTYPVTVLFKGGCKTVPVLLAQAGEEITVPPEVLKAPFMLVSCYCGDLITADSARVKINPSGYTESPDPSDPEAPSYYSQMIAYIDQINALIGENADAKDTLTNLQDVIDKAQSATTRPNQTIIGQMDALIDQYISNEDAVAYQLIEKTILTVKSNVKIAEQYVFAYCPNLKAVNLPEAENIKSNAFRESTALMRVNVPKTKHLYSGAFYWCKALTKVDLPIVEIIDYQAFSGSGIQTIIIRTAACVLTSPQSIQTGVYIYVPRNDVEQYKTGTNWTVHADHIRAIEDYPDICAPEEWED